MQPIAAIAIAGNRGISVSRQSAPTFSDAEQKLLLGFLVVLPQLGVLWMALHSRQPDVPAKGTCGDAYFKPPIKSLELSNASCKESHQGHMSYEASLKKCIALVYVMLLRPAAAQTTCAADTLLTIESGFSSRILQTEAFLSLYQSDYNALSTRYNATLSSQLYTLGTVFDTCLLTPSGENQYAQLQQCTASVSTQLAAFSSPLLDWRNALTLRLDQGYLSVYPTLSAVVPYTASVFSPVESLFFQQKERYETVCDLVYLPPFFSNQTQLAIQANDAFAAQLSQSYEAVNLSFGSQSLVLTEALSTAVLDCKGRLNAPEIVSCLTLQKNTFDGDKNRLLTLGASFAMQISELPVSSTQRTAFSSNAIIDYKSRCDLISAIGLGIDQCLVKPSFFPTPSPVAQPEGVPTLLPTSNPSQKEATYTAGENGEAEKCANMGAAAFGVMTTVLGVLVGGGVGWSLGRRQLTHTLEREAAKKLEAKHRPIDQVPDTPLEETSAVGVVTSIQGVLGQSPFLSRWLPASVREQLFVTHAALPTILPHQQGERDHSVMRQETEGKSQQNGYGGILGLEDQVDL